MVHVTVLLVDDHILFRKGLASLLSSRDGIEIVGEAGDGCEAIEKARETLPDIILMDVYMPRCDGLEAVRAIKSELPNTKIIMVTVDEQDKVLFEAIKSGAQGYLFKKMHPQQLFDMVETVAKGEVALSPGMMAKILNEFQHPSAQPGRDGPIREELSLREAQVLELVARGATNKEIANDLNITENTVKKHLQSILTKLHLQNRIQAAVYAVQEGLLSNASRF
jgi:two-component system nitrate/nitrite response regulator NarL